MTKENDVLPFYNKIERYVTIVPTDKAAGQFFMKVKCGYSEYRSNSKLRLAMCIAKSVLLCHRLSGLTEDYVILYSKSEYDANYTSVTTESFS